MAFLNEARIVRRYADNVVGVYLDADDVTRDAGTYWYHEEGRRLEEWAKLVNVPFSGACGAAAAISPGMSWEWVYVYLDALLRNRKAKVPTYSREFVDRAWRCLSGADPESVLSGPKVTAFYRALFSFGTSSSIVIDGHAWNIARGGWSPIRSEVDNDGRVTPARYRIASAAYRLAAEDLTQWPCAVQAATWLHWRMLIKAK